jgi:hypothetical protein
MPSSPNSQAAWKGFIARHLGMLNVLNGVASQKAEGPAILSSISRPKRVCIATA